MNNEYQDKLQAASPKEQAMFTLCWEIHELTELVTLSRQQLVDVKVLLDMLFKESDNMAANLPRRLHTFKSEQTQFVKRLTRFKRTPATHIFVVMISSDQRQKKPYALPVQCLPYAGMSEKDIRSIISNLVNKMVHHGMSVQGIQTMQGFIQDFQLDGEI